MGEDGSRPVDVVLQLHQPDENVVEPGQFAFSQQAADCLVLALDNFVDLRHPLASQVGQHQVELPLVTLAGLAVDQTRP